MAVESNVLHENPIPPNPQRDAFVAKKLPFMIGDRGMVDQPYYRDYLSLMQGCVGALEAPGINLLQEDELRSLLTKLGKEYDIPDQLLPTVLDKARIIYNKWISKKIQTQRRDHKETAY